jgi:hypothetical protein
MNNDRQSIIEKDRSRRQARAVLQGDVADAKHDLHPRTMLDRWKGKKRAQLADATDSTKQIFAKNAPLIGLAGAAILLFSLRKPISNAFTTLRDKVRQAKDRKS